MRQTLRISIHVQLTLLLNSTWSCVEVCYDDEEQRTGGQNFRLLITSFQFTVAFSDSSHFSDLQSLAAIFLTMNYLDGKAEMMT